MSGEDHIRATGGARSVVFLHGIGAGAEMFAPQISGLGKRCDAIGWNLPGYGGHDLDGEMTFDGLTEGLLAFLDRLHLARVDLVGHSIGGMLAQAFVARHPERVRTLVLSATTAAFGSRDGSFQKQFVTERLAPLDAGRTMPDLAAEFVPGLVGSQALPEAAEQARAAMSQVPEATYRAAIRCLATFDEREALSRIPVPVLLIAGGEDQNAPAPTMRRMSEKISGACFVELDGIGHLAPLECPDAFTGEIQSFLNDTAL
ncbi:alpha/beta fold hydrolase [Stappia sp. ES.058]|uniref:alpha/beta fold hydrolase n=1 Tax=Stappia sp. ES.058 TaxID=1881061 RepID=UPI00087C9668|nr:alpha/beta hydrolase [Stappia sp. ES.058]SDU41122.1 Pimeloyl-ACP methyl ester carboxylesterase [Stappia sp. ES.058]